MDVGAEFDEDGVGGVMVDTGNGGQEADLLAVGCQPLPDEGIVPGDPLFGLCEGGQLVPEDEARMGGQALEDAPPVGAEQIGQDAADTDADAVEDLVGAGAQGGAVMDDLAPLARDKELLDKPA